MPWHTLYGKGDGVDPEVYAAWVKKERERIREVLRRRRAALRERGLKLDGRLKDEPSYPERTLASMERWIDAHAVPTRGMPLAEVVHYMRRAAREEGIEYDCIQGQGAAKYLRKLGFKLHRSNEGMIVEGLWVR